MSEIIEQKDTFKLAIRKHESFSLRKGWLHKGIRNIKKSVRVFLNDDSCDVLGIGANMVKALRYWLKATQVITEDGKRLPSLTETGKVIDRCDPYFEERGTNYIIHYLLASNKENATAWWWFFNIHKGTTIDKTQFIEEFSDFCKYHSKDEVIPSLDVLKSEYDTLIKTYRAQDEEKDKNEDPEDTTICPLTELRLVVLNEIRRKDGTEKEYKKAMPDKDDIHPWIAYAVISKKQELLGTDEINISELLNGEKNIGKIFNLDRSTIFYLLEKIERLGLIKITRTAGLDVIRIKKTVKFEDCLIAYYKTLSGEVHNG